MTETSAIPTLVRLDRIQLGNNPRRYFDQAKHEELVRSMKLRGVLQPLLLRPAEEIRPWMSALAGLLVAAATLIKYQAGIMVAVVLLYFCLWFPWRIALKRSTWFLLGGTTLPALMLVYLHHAEALTDFWYWNFGGSLRYIQGGSAAVDLGRKIKSHVLTYLGCTALVWGLSALRFRTWWRNGLSAWRRDPREAGIWLWFFLCIIPVCLGRRFYGHYFLILMPQLCVLSALQIVSWDASAWLKCCKWIAALIVLPFVATTIPRYYMRPFYNAVHEEVISDAKPYGDYIKSHTQPGDRILVWGFSPAVYWYADRLPATRFLWSDVLVGRLPGLQVDLESGIDFTRLERPELWKMFYADLGAHPPACIKDMASTGIHNYQHFPTSRYPHLMDYIAAHYTPEPDLLGAKVFRRKDVADRSGPP